MKTDFTEYYKKLEQQRIEKRDAEKRRPKEMADKLAKVQNSLKQSVSTSLNSSDQTALLESIEKLIDFKLEQFKYEYNKEIDHAIRSAPTVGPW